MDKFIKSSAVTAAAVLSAGFLLCGCQMKGSEKAGAPKQPSPQASAQELFSRGLGLYNKGQWNEAVTVFNQAVKLEPKNARFYSARGSAYEKMGNIPFAIVDFSRAIELDSGTAEFYNNRSKAYFAVNDYEKALADAKKAESLGMNVSALKKKIMAAGKIFGENEFVLTGIMVDNMQGYLAIINNEIVGVGSVVNKARVIEITQYHVRLDLEGKVIVKTLPSSDLATQAEPAAK